MSDESKHGWHNEDISIVRLVKYETYREIEIHFDYVAEYVELDRADIIELCRMMDIETVNKGEQND